MFLTISTGRSVLIYVKKANKKQPCNGDALQGCLGKLGSLLWEFCFNSRDLGIHIGGISCLKVCFDR